MFRFNTAGESHGRALVAIVEGLPAGLAVDFELVNRELARRQHGYGRGGRMKIESDRAEVLSGVRHGRTLGSPVALQIENKDWKNWTDVMSAGPLAPDDAPDEKRMRRVRGPRPGRADLAGGLKYNARDLRDIVARASARETGARVACGPLAKPLLAVFGVGIRSHVAQLGGVAPAPLEVDWEGVCAIPDDAPLRCADAAAQDAMVALVDQK